MTVGAVIVALMDRCTAVIAALQTSAQYGQSLGLKASYVGPGSEFVAHVAQGDD